MAVIVIPEVCFNAWRVIPAASRRWRISSPTTARHARLLLESVGSRIRKSASARSPASQRIFSGIGNAYSDEILHRAKLSPFKLSTKLSDEEIARLHAATLETLALWTQRLRDEVGDGFPDKVTAFRDEMAVHGKYRSPCPVCEAPIQRIRYADNEANYCPGCQTGCCVARPMSR